jgi:glycosylphosphatidylinositol deacylase
MGILLLVVLFFAPHQFAFLVIFLVHFFSTVRSLLVVQDLPATPAATKRLWDRYHYSFSILFIMFCLLPINALILVVWVRNLAVGWLAPFASDHNVFSVIGFLLNVEAIHSGKMLSRTKNRYDFKYTLQTTIYLTNSLNLPLLIRIRAIFTTLLPTVTAAYGLLYGIRYTHDIFPLANVFYLWLAAMSSEAIVGVVHDVVVGKRKNSLSSLPSPREIVAVPLRTTKR